jgi:hypothetical protein
MSHSVDEDRLIVANLVKSSKFYEKLAKTFLLRISFRCMTYQILFGCCNDDHPFDWPMIIVNASNKPSLCTHQSFSTQELRSGCKCWLSASQMLRHLYHLMQTMAQNWHLLVYLAHCSLQECSRLCPEVIQGTIRD